MAARKIPFLVGEYYHVFNRGTDKRIIFSDEYDLDRFLKSMEEFNVLDPIGSIYENSRTKKDHRGGKASTVEEKMRNKKNKLVAFVAYCLNPNHYHFVMTPLVEKGIEKFMQRIGTGYTMYFNEKEKRNGGLFQGKFKAVHINTNEYLLLASAYVNLNDRVHKLDKRGGLASTFVKSRSSWWEYIMEVEEGFCSKDIILKQFKNRKEYQNFAESSLRSTLERRANFDGIEKLSLEE